MSTTKRSDTLPGNESLFHSYILRAAEKITLSDQTVSNCTWSSSALLGIMTMTAIAIGGDDRWQEVLKSFKNEQNFMASFEAVAQFVVVKQYIDNYIAHAEKIPLDFDINQLNRIFVFAVMHLDEQPEIYGALLKTFIDNGITVNLTYIDNYEIAKKATEFLQREYKADDATLCELIGLYTTPGMHTSKGHTEFATYYLQDGNLLEKGDASVTP